MTVTPPVVRRPQPPASSDRSAGGRFALREVVRVPPLHLAAGAAVTIGIFLYVYAFRANYIDDAYIQLRYARTLLDSGTWGF